MSEQDKTGKGPKTLFSLARSKDKAKRGGVVVDEPADVPVEDPADDLDAEPAGEVLAEVPQDDAVPDLVDELSAGGELGDGDELVYFCGECGEELPNGAAFCGECGTPVALDDEDDADLGEYEAQELAAMDSEPDSARIPAYVAAGVGGAAAEDDDEAWSADELAEEDPIADAALAEPLAEDPVVDDGVVAPADPVAAPADPVDAPGDAAVAPADTVDAPGDAAVAPVDPVDAPAEAVDAPAATLYGESTDFEPLAPPPPVAGWDLATPVMGTSESDVAEETVPGADDDSGEDRDTEPKSEDAPTIPVAVAAAGGAAVGATLAGGATAAADEVHPYDTLATARAKPAGGPNGGGTTTQTGSRKGLWIAAAAAAVLLGIIAVIVIATSGSKSNDNADVATATAESTTTTAAKESTTSSTAESTTTTTTQETTTTAAPTTVAPTTPAPAPGPGGSAGGSTGGGAAPQPPSSPAYVSVSPGSGTICIPSHGSFAITLVNQGGSNGQFQVRANGLNGSTSGSLSPGQGASVTVSDGSAGERTVSVQVVAAGSGTVSYTVLVGRAGC